MSSWQVSIQRAPSLREKFMIDIFQIAGFLKKVEELRELKCFVPNLLRLMLIVRTSMALISSHERMQDHGHGIVKRDSIFALVDPIVYIVILSVGISLVLSLNFLLRFIASPLWA